MKELNQIAREHLARHGIYAPLSNIVELGLSPVDLDGNQRANISVGYIDGTRRRETTVVSLPSLDKALAALADKDHIGCILSLGVRAMPASKRPEMPDWVTNSAEAQRARQGMRKANKLADAAARGNVISDDKDHGDAPF